MIRGYRWISTGSYVWQLEGPPKSRRFHATVNRYGPDRWTWYLNHTVAVPGGESSTKRAAQDAAEDAVRDSLEKKQDVPR